MCACGFPGSTGADGSHRSGNPACDSVPCIATVLLPQFLGPVQPVLVIKLQAHAQTCDASQTHTDAVKSTACGHSQTRLRSRFIKANRLVPRLALPDPVSPRGWDGSKW